jgi:hypothetical protein
VPENERTGMPQHEAYEELCALAAGGLLEEADLVDFRAHMKECSQCRSDYQESLTLVTRDLPQSEGPFRQKLAAMRAKPLPGSRQRFLRRAQAEGVIFSPEVDAPVRSAPWPFRPILLAPIAAVVVAAVGLAAYRLYQTPDTARTKDANTAQQIAELERRNSALTASLARLNESLAAGQRENQNLRAQMGSASTTAENLRRSSSQNVQLLDESRNQEKLLAEARDESAQSSQLRINDEASLVEQQARITELSNKLRVASATLDMEQRLVASGRDVPALMAARQLHVIDVHDTDPNGNPSQAFGRVFLAEGKSLTFYAFDLDEDKAANGKRSFQVWAAMETGKNSARSLGFLRLDAKSQGRWVLNVQNPELLKQIGSVFVTVEPAAGGQHPDGQKLLYAYLGEANHP